MKYKVKQYILRSAPLILVCCMFVFVFSPSASAAGIDYNDLNPTIVVDGDNDIVTFSFSPDQFVSYLFAAGYTPTSFNGSFSFDAKAGVYYDIYTNLTPSYLDTYNIPNDTTLSFSCRIEGDAGSGAYETPSLLLTYRYWRDGEIVDSTESNLGQNGFNQVFVGGVVINKDLYDGVSFESAIWHIKTYVDTTLTITFDSMDFTMSINSAYRAAMLSQKNSQVIKEIEKQLAEQGKTMEDVLDQQTQTNDKLDDIINGEVTPEAPEGADKVGDLDDAEGQLRDEAQVGLDQGVEIQQSVLQILEEYANGFAVFSWLFGLFAKLPFFSGLLYVSVALGTVSALLNLGLSAQSASHRSQRRKKGG